MTWKHIIYTVIFFASFVGGKIAYNALFGESDKAEFKFSDWDKRNYVGISYEAPFELSETDLGIPANLKPFIKYLYTYQYTSKAIAFMVSKAEYSSDIQTDLEGATQGAVHNMSNSEGVSDFKYDAKDIMKYGLVGKRIDGTLKMDGQDAEIIAEFYNKGSKLIQIIWTNLSYDENRKVRDRLFKSLKITLY